MALIAASAAIVVPQPGNKKPDLWEEALNTLSAEDRQEYVDSSTRPYEVLQKVQEATESSKEACVAKGWRVYRKKNGEVVKLRHVLEKLSVWVESAIKIIDVGVSFDQSGHAALPWGIVKFLVTMGKSNIEVFSNIVEQVESISSLIARYAVIEKLYLDGAGEATIGLLESITKFYAAILTYLARAKRYFSENSLKQIGRGLLEAARKHYDTAKISETEIHTWMSMVERESDQQTAKRVIENREALEKILHDFNRPIIRMAVQVADLHDKLDREERTRVFYWLSKIDYGRHHDDLKKNLLPDTGQWLFDSQPFLEWGQSSASSILWIHGIPGSGKTRLVSRVIDVMHDESTSKRSPIAFFYCARSTAEPERGKPDEVLGAILKQLCSSEPDKPIRKPIATEYASRMRKADDDYSRIRKLSVEDCTGLILELTKDSPATIIIDALDECDEENRYELLEALDDIIANSVEVVKVVVSSRDDVDIKLHLEHCTNISISANRNEGDIARFVLSEVDRLISKKLLLDGRVPKPLKKRIIKTLTNGAQGMFRWVAMSLETLQQIKFRPDFEKALGQLPSKLSELYDIIHSQIDQTATHGRDVAIKSLKWLLCAQRLLTVEELAAAVQLPYDEAIKSSSGSDDSDVTDDKTSGADDSKYRDIETKSWIENDIVRLCRNLVVVDSERKVFRFAHQSVREYLLTRKEYTDMDQHALVAERCLEIYEVEASPDRAKPILTSQNDILKPYARGYWPVHYKYLDDLGSRESRRRLREFMIQDSTKPLPYRQWVVDMNDNSGIQDHPERIRQSLGLDMEDPLPSRLVYALAEPHTPLSIICAFGLSSMLNEFEISFVELDQPLETKYYPFSTTLLMIASAQGDAELVRVLLDKRASVNALSRHGRSALQLATEEGHESIVRLLLENEADVNTFNVGKTALQLACEADHESIVRLLLEHEADVNALSRYNDTALLLAFEEGHESIVRLLLKHEADVNTLNDNSNSALHLASKEGHDPIVRLLLEHEVNDHTFDFRGKSALHLASQEGHESTVRLLLQYEADVNALNFYDESALHLACKANHESIVRLLLQYEADVNALNDRGESALHLACKANHESIVRLLLEHGAEINAQDSDGWSSLHLTLWSGSESTVQMLLEHGADVNALKEDCQTPLHVASWTGFESVVQMLLEHGAEINAQDSDGRSPLHWAAERGHAQIMQVLIDNGADINVLDKNGRTPLDLAQEENEEEDQSGEASGDKSEHRSEDGSEEKKGSASEADMDGLGVRDDIFEAKNTI